MGSESLAFRICRDALEAGVFATPVMFPAVPLGQALIRTTVMPTHEMEQLEKGLEVFGELRRRFELPEVDPEHLPEAAQMDLTHFFLAAQQAAAPVAAPRAAGPR